MRAKSDLDPNLSPFDAANRVFTEEFIAELANRFEFDASEQELGNAIREIGYRYILGRRLEESDSHIRQVRNEYRRLLTVSGRFETAVKNSNSDLARYMHEAARELKEPKPQTEFVQLTDHEKRRGEPFLFELYRLLGILQLGLRRQIERSTSQGGRPKNFGLETCLHYAADLWVMDLGRRFSLDHHKGAGLTEAFEFVRALVTPLDDVTDSQIITAMRREIRSRRAHNIPT